jgi:hypothetical protein
MTRQIMGVLDSLIYLQVQFAVLDGEVVESVPDYVRMMSPFALVHWKELCPNEKEVCLLKNVMV